MTTKEWLLDQCLSCWGTSCVLKIAFEKSVGKKINTELTENFTRFAPVIDTGFDIQVQLESFDKALKHELESLSLPPEVVPFLILVLLVYGYVEESKIFC